MKKARDVDMGVKKMIGLSVTVLAAMFAQYSTMVLSMEIVAMMMECRKECCSGYPKKRYIPAQLVATSILTSLVNTAILERLLKKLTANRWE